MALKGKRESGGLEFAQLFGILLTIVAVAIGIWIIRKYFFLMELAITTGTGIAPDVAIAITALTAMIVPNLAYEAYQGFLKNSRNKHGVDKNGNPHARKTKDEEV